MPIPPTAGVIDVHPAGALKLTNVVLPGTSSVSVTLDAASGPMLRTLIVYVMFSPGSTAAGDAVFVTSRSASADARAGAVSAALQTSSMSARHRNPARPARGPIHDCATIRP